MSLASCTRWHPAWDASNNQTGLRKSEINSQKSKQSVSSPLTLWAEQTARKPEPEPRSRWAAGAGPALSIGLTSLCLCPPFRPGCQHKGQTITGPPFWFTLLFSVCCLWLWTVGLNVNLEVAVCCKTAVKRGVHALLFEAVVPSAAVTQTSSFPLSQTMLARRRAAFNKTLI